MKKLLAVLIAFAALAAGAQDFIVNNGAEPQTLDPSHIQGNVEHRIYMSLFEGLVVNDPRTARAAPGIAESWATSADGLSLTFKLRKAQWSDGTPVTAKDFVEGWLRTLAPETGAEYAYMIGTVVKGASAYNLGKGRREDVALRAINDRTLEVGLVGPLAYAVDVMTHYAFAPIPMHALAKNGDDWIKPGKFVGNGPFVLKEWRPQSHILVEKSKTYWDQRNVKLKSIKFLPIEDNKTGYNLYKAGECDWQTAVPLDLIDEIKLRTDYQATTTLRTYYYIFNVTKKPLDDVRVRKALAMAIDKATLIDKVLKGGELIADGFVPPMSGYAAPKGNAYNLEEARKLLAAAGFPGGQGFPRLTVIYNTNDSHKKIAEYAQAEWKKNLGIEVALQNQEWKTFLDTRSNSHDFEIARAGWIGDYQDPSNFLEIFLTGGGNNDGLYSNPKFDELMKKAASMKAGPERLKVLAEAESLLMVQDQAVASFYHQPSQNLIDTKKWGGWYGNPLDIHNWKFIFRK